MALRATSCRSRRKKQQQKEDDDRCRVQKSEKKKTQILRGQRVFRMVVFHLPKYLDGVGNVAGGGLHVGVAHLKELVASRNYVFGCFGARTCLCAALTNISSILA
ncbi:hypothetical protein U1Q18_046954, partial [Sarracenia purpurea var. burkii]